MPCFTLNTRTGSWKQVFIQIGRRSLAITLLLILCACTTTIQPISGHTPSLQSAGSSKETASDRTLKDLPPGELVRIGNDYLDKGNHKLARLHFSVAAGKDPESAAAYVGLGETMRRAGEVKRAGEVFDQALQKDQSYLPALLGIARTCRGQGDHSAAIEYLNRAVELAPEDAEVLTEMAMAYGSLGQVTEAEAVYAQVAALKPSLASSHNNLGFVYLIQGRYADAVKAFSQSVSIAPRNKQIQNNLAAAYALNGNDEKALQIFEKTVGKAAASNNMGYIYMTRGDWGKAEKAFKRALDLNPTFYVKAQENLDRLTRLRTEAGQ